MKAKLVSPVPSSSDWEIELEQFPVMIGRSPEAEIQLLDSCVSERHCELESINGRLMVRDLGSECGSFVNGVKVDIAPLLPGDKLTVGNASFIAAYDPPVATPRSPILEDSRFPVLGPSTRDDVTFVHLVNLLEKQRRIFRQRYNQEVWQMEPMFPDPPHPEHIEHLLVEEMKHDCVPPQFIYAFEQTGILVTEFNYDILSEYEVGKWQAAVEEYEARCADSGDEQRYPVGAITMYGPDKSTTTMIMAAVLTDADSEPIYRRWVGSRVTTNQGVREEMTEFFREYGVRSVIHVRDNVGCPHQEGLDYSVGYDCPFCPYWKGSQQDPT